MTDPDSRALARRTVKAKAWALEEAVASGLARAAGLGFTSVLVAGEPTGDRWRVDRLEDPRGGSRAAP